MVNIICWYVWHKTFKFKWLEIISWNNKLKYMLKYIIKKRLINKFNEEEMIQ